MVNLTKNILGQRDTRRYDGYGSLEIVALNLARNVRREIAYHVLERIVLIGRHFEVGDVLGYF